MALKPDISNELRAMVRDVLREVMPAKNATAAGVEPVRLTNDGELAAFVTRLVDPATAEAVRAGKLRFTLASSPVTSALPVAASAAPLQGVITEQKIDKLAGSGVVVLAADAVLTPLARDKARRMGLKIERRR